MATQVGFQLESSLASKHLTDAEYIKGGYIVVKTLAERNALPIYIENEGTVTQDGIIVTGSLVYVSDEQKSYRYNGTAWVEEASSQGGTVTSITAGTGLIGGTITTSGTIAIDEDIVALKEDLPEGEVNLTLTETSISDGTTTLSLKITAEDKTIDW